MPDWRKIVRERLGPLGLSPMRENEVFAELAEHLEDESEGRGPKGPAPHTEQSTNWQSLAYEIRKAEEDPMSSTAKTIWLPGTSVLIAAAVLLLVMARLVPPATWVDGKGPMLLVVTWVIAYLAFGALGAYWSRQAGGDTKARLLSGVFPVMMHLAVFVLPVLVNLASNSPKFPEHGQLTFLLAAGFGWVVIPAIVLAIGTLPFLRDRSDLTPRT